ncbi:3,4-dihydroxy-2-butanone-4-phosphate synthase [Mycolicibacterium sp.]|uniref:3,4-dihydroxy-2-butanone-4-phosphate synthase n=1 Tax=Mycolicibacterium sp. TaxID=2320850 RepID=UPI003D0BC444
MRTIDARVRRAVTAVAAGRPAVVIDDGPADHQGYLVFAADAATPALLAFTIRHTSGYVRVALPGSECDRLNLPPMWHPGEGRCAAHRVAVDARGPGTGISACDRARTIAALASPHSAAMDFVRPGHVVPVAAADGGVLARRGPVEAAADLARLAGRGRAAGLCDIVSQERPTAMACGAELVEFAIEHGLAVVSIGELAAHRRRTEPQVTRLAEAVVPTPAGQSRVIGFRHVHDGGEHLAVLIGEVGTGAAVPFHVHVECLTGDVFGSTACRCAGELDTALGTMWAAGRGVIVYLRPPGRLRACGLLDRGLHGGSEVVTWVLRDLGLYAIRLSEDMPGVGLAMFGTIRAQGLRAVS